MNFFSETKIEQVDIVTIQSILNKYYFEDFLDLKKD